MIWQDFFFILFALKENNSFAMGGVQCDKSGFYLCRLLKKKLFKEELEPQWPGPDKVCNHVTCLCVM